MFGFNGTDKVFEKLTNSGAFLTAGKTPNVMTISWAMTGVLWGQKVLLVPVRESRYTKVKIDASNEFTVSVPFDRLGKELAYCGSHSGRSCNKFHETDLMPVKAKEVDTSVIHGCDYYFECTVLAKIPLTDEIAAQVLTMYPKKDFHTLYIGKVVAEYAK
ncbi:MAG: flavin reductase family protein [Clostridiales bacterium]|jgi:flavin reductase (DIM6/NTAB) family NADH-FMN oxidoreductase RutF|nr:flavin reductase family protein [Clostridiales bacterium]